MRGFLSGVIWGGVVSVLSLGVVSQLAQAPQRSPDVAANLPGAPEASPQSVTPEAAESVVSSDPGVAPSDFETAQGEGGSTDAAPLTTASDAPEVAASVAAAPEVAIADTTAPGAGVPEVTAAEPADHAAGEHDGVAPEIVTPEVVTPAPDAAESATGEAETDEAASTGSEVASAAPEAATAEGADAMPPEPAAGQIAEAEPVAPPVPQIDPAAEAPEDLAPLPGEVPAHSPLAPEPEPDAAEAAEPAAPSEPLLDKPTVGIDGAAAGVVTNQLPRIEAAPAAPADPDNQAATAPDLRPVAQFAAPFDNPAQKPLYAILLVDDGKAQIDRAALAALKVPVTIVIDPATPDATKLQALYRAAGKEVAMLASGIPAGAKASDLEVTFESHARTLPEAVAVVDLPQGGFQNNRLLASAVVPVLKDQGRGLVTFDRGSNAGDQVARREAVPTAVIFRELDAAGEAAPLIRRYLDRAAFKAAQDGRVAVLGHANAETIAALLEWSLEGRAGSVALAPLTAVMAQPD